MNRVSTKQEKQYLEMLLFWQTKDTMAINASVLCILSD